jgi:hypothetical protein
MPAADSVGRRAWRPQAIQFPTRCREMNRIRWIAFCIAGVAILTFTRFPNAATMQTRVDYAAAEVNYHGAIKSNLEWKLADAAARKSK